MNPERFDKILVVDDSSANLQLLMNLLSEHGYRVFPASDGELALEFVQSTLPDLILLDIKMPGMDGYEVCRRLKADQRTNTIPIIFLSALEDEHDKVKGFQAGGVDYITKPFQPEEMLARVATHLRLRELTEGLEQEVDSRTEELTIANNQLQQEIAERKQAEEALRESRQRLGNIVSNSPGAIFRCANDEAWTMEFISAGITQISGYPSDEFLNNRVRSYNSIIHPDDRQSVVEAVTAALANKKRFDLEYRLLAADGRPRWVHEQGQGVFTPEGQLLCLDGVIFDITTQRKAEESLMLNAERMEAMLRLNQMIDASEIELMAFAYETAIRLTHSKLGYLGLINEDETSMNVQFWSPEAMAECKVPDTPMIFPLKSAGLWGEAVRQRRPIITNDYASPNPWKKGTPEGHIELIRHMNLPLIAGGKIVLIAGVGNKEEDYTEDDVQQLSLLIEGMWRMIERRRAEDKLTQYQTRLEETVQQRTEELRLSLEAAEAANKAKSVFLANMSHELRTPLNAILGFSNIIHMDPQLPKNQRRNVDIISRSGEHLLTLINDVLQMAKIEAGGVELANTPFDLGGMVRDVIDMMQMRAKDRNLQLVIDQSSKFPRYIVGDAARLRQILINMIGNAIKFTKEGSVNLRLGTKHNESSHLLIEVEDTGPGIAKQDQKHIFEPFVQLSKQGENKGTGLGLTITRQFVQIMGGQISLKSALGKGSLFTIDLPMTEAAERDIAQAKQLPIGNVTGLAPGQPEYRILIVEDQLDNQLLLTNLLQSVGLRIKVAENGKQGVELFQRWQPHLIFMDRRMPVMDGEEATRTIRELPGGQSVKIVAVTASAFNEQKKSMIDAGVDDFIGKPYHLDEIYTCLSNQLGIRFQYEESKETQKHTYKLTPEMVAVLPEKLRNELQGALESLESRKIYMSIQQVAAYDQELYSSLIQCAENFDYPAILQALKSD
jgi:PAS domain S-box-containing protein